MGIKLFGYVDDLVVERDDMLIYLSGISQESKMPSFGAYLTFRVTHLLWHRLTQALYPHDAPTMISSASTAPLRMPDERLVTTHVELSRLENGGYEITGRITSGHWRIRLTAQNAHRLWAVLDVLLYPVGWQGREGITDDDDIAPA